MKSLIVGMGEVGRALHEVLRTRHECATYDATDGPIDKNYFRPIAVLNVCLPYSEFFVEVVRMYAVTTSASLVIVHSTVPVGTTRKIQDGLDCGVVHSPIHGRHPNLAPGIRTFTKYVGACNDSAGVDAVDYLRAAGIYAVLVANPETSELSKLACTSQTAVGVLVMQEIYRLCEESGADFSEVYGWNEHYNAGYAKLDQAHFARPQYKYTPGKLGGHCLKPNASLFEGWMADLIKEKG